MLRQYLLPLIWLNNNPLFLVFDMKIPSWLYGLQKSDELTHTHYSTGEIDEEALFQCRPDFWLEPGKEIPFKKKLIFCDFTIDRSKMYRKLELIEIFNHLLEQNFELYFWIDYELEKIDKVDPRRWLDLIETSDEAEDSKKPKVKLSSKEDLITAAGKLNISADELLLLDYFKCRQLRHDCLQSIDKDDIFAIDVIDVYRCRVKRWSKYFLDHKPTHYIRTTDDKNEIYYINTIKQLLTLNLTEKKSLTNDVTEIVSTTFSGKTFTIKSFLQLLSKGSKYKEITLINCKLIMDETQITYDELQQLASNITSLTFSYCEIHISLIELLIYLPNLQALDLYETEENIAEQQISLPTISFAKLTFLDLQICRLSLKTWCYIVQFSNLQFMKLSDCEFLNDLPFQEVLGQGYLPHLESLDLSGTMLSSKILENILSNSKKLTKVLLYNSLDKEPHSNLLPSLMMAPNLREFRHEDTDLEFIDEKSIGMTANRRSTIKILKLRAILYADVLVQCLNAMADLKKFSLMGKVEYSNQDFEKIISALCKSKKLKVFKTQCDIPPQLIYRLLEHVAGLEAVTLYHYAYYDEIQYNPKFSRYQDVIKVTKPFVKQINRFNTLIDSKSSNQSQSASKIQAYPRSASNELLIDADTTLRNIHFKLERIFYARIGKHPDPALYREDIFQELMISEDLKNDKPFLLKQTPLSLVPCFIKWADSSENLLTCFRTEVCQDDLFYGSKSFLLTNTWQPLPSLSAREVITHIYLEKTTRENVEIRYGSDNRYHIRKYDLQAPCEVEIKYLLKIPSITKSIPLWLRLKIDDYNRFNACPLKNTDFMFTGYDYLHAMKSQRTGSCIQRSICFFYDLLGINKEIDLNYANNSSVKRVEARIACSQSHAWVEVLIDDMWVSCDLGGYPVTTEIVDTTEKSLLEMDLQPLDKINPLFKTWNSTETPKPISLEYYLRKILLNRRKNVLVDIPPGDPTIQLSLLLQETCLNANQPCYYLDSPADFICSSNWIDYFDDESGVLKNGPGGSLHQFLIDQKGAGPVLIVNLNNFKPEDIVRLNSFIDHERIIDGTPVPLKALVICLYDYKSQNAYKGADLYSRIDHKYDMHIDLSVLSERTQHLTQINFEDNESPSMSLNLFKSPYWRSLLLGQWSLQGVKVFYRKSSFLESLPTASLSLHIQNAPNDPDFKLFWQLAKLNKKIQIANRVFPLPENLKINFSEGYDDDLRTYLTWGNTNSSFYPIRYSLNPTAFRRFFRDYTYRDGKIFEKPGILAVNAGNVLHVQLTRDLVSFDQWALLLESVRTYSIKLHVFTTDSIQLKGAKTLTSEVVQDFINKPQTSTSDLASSAIAKIIITNDIGMAVQNAKQTLNYHVFDISECHSSDILIKRNITFKKDECTFEFEQSFSEVWLRLQQGENVILKGDFSEELIDSLSPFCFPLMAVPEELSISTHCGKLLLISTNKALFNGMPYQTIFFSKHEIERKLIEKFGMILVKKNPSCLEYHYTKANQILTYASAKPFEVPLSRWTASEKTPNAISYDSALIDLSWDAYHKFECGRVRLLQEAFHLSPLVFIFGETGVGKSTFVQKTLSSNSKIHVYQGENGIQDWAMDQSSGYLKVLFFDEFNLGGKNYSNLDGIFSLEILHDKIHIVTPLHKVIFAGNPFSYSSLRNIPSLFDCYGNAIVFPELSPAFIYHQNLKPIFLNVFDEKVSYQIGLTLLKSYVYIKNLNPNTILISPRELEMMALQIISLPCTTLLSALQLIYDFSHALLKEPLSHQFNDWFENAFSFKPNLAHNQALHIGDFILTPTHYNAYQQLLRMLSVRDYQQKSNEEAKQFSGLGGIIFEGTSGNGKSEFVINVLKTQGYQKAELNAPSTSGKYYYKLPVGMSSVKKDALLLKAFHEGAVVIIDEINSCHLNEVLLNCLLMGRDLNGKRARVPGFKLIGTQNSIDNLGRKAKSQAIERRFLTCLFDDYPLHVLIRILKEKSLDDALAKKLSLEFIQARDHAIAFNLKPLPNIRILMKVVNRTLKEKDQEFNRSFLSFRDHKVLPQARGRQSMQPPIKKTKTARSSSHNP